MFYCWSTLFIVMPLVSEISFVLLLPILASCQTVSGNTKTCPEKQFYDHGTKKCEPCSDYCRDVQIEIYAELCRDLCPTVHALMVKMEQKPEHAAISMTDDAHTVSDEYSSLSASTTIIIVIVGSITVIVGLTILGLMLSKVQQNRSEHSGRDPVPDEEVADGLSHGVQEANDEQAESERLSQSRGWLYAMCDPRNLVSRYFYTEETKTGREGHHETALLGNNQGSGIQETVQPKTHHMVVATPIFKPSGSMWSSSQV